MKKKLYILFVLIVVAFVTAFAAYEHQHRNVYTLLEDNCERGCQYFDCNCGLHLRKCGKCGASLESTMQGDQERKRTLYFAKCKKCPHQSVWAVYNKY